MSNNQSRGVTGSASRTSWTGSPELADFESVAGFVVCYLLRVHVLLVAHEGTSKPQSLKLILGGYSFGSSLVSRLPAASEVAIKYKGSGTSQREEVRRIAEDLATRHAECQRNYQGRNDIELLHVNGWETFILLVSPLLPPATIFVATLSWSRFHIPSVRDQQLLTQNHTLALFGDHDNFTSSTKLQKWAQRLANDESSRFHYETITRADHFWRSELLTAALQAKIEQWVRRVVHGS